ncbi:MAG: SpoIVB peptidase S55 domain-containing protein [Holophaga sp.]|nr:SpoIVB peptidase S55 domain-containing protein [Holophaga sp.]
MLKYLRLLLPLFLVAVLSAQAPATMSVLEIRPGMKGQGRTVFVGGRIEHFNFEVLGIQRNLTPGRSLIMVRASGGPLAETGILQGMSGSPCYIDGKLIGALAIAFPFEKEPIGGVTPIAEMLDQLRDLPDLPPSRTPLILPKMAPPTVLKSALIGQMVPMAQLLGTDTGIPDGGQEIPMPVFGANLSPEARSFWAGTPVSFMAGQAGASAGGGEASPIEPGGMAAINMVQGDMVMSGAGTITYVSGKRILLFGHQLFNLGELDLPLWSATVAASMPSYQSSFKLAAPVAPIGALRLDRSAGVAGLIGAQAHMIPLRIGLNLGGRRILNFRYEIMDHPIITPSLAATVLAQTIATHVRGQGFQSLSLQGNIKLANHPAVEIESMVADLSAGRVSSYLGAILQAITLNPFERPVIEGISLTVKAEERLDLTAIAGVRTLKARVKRGQALPVLVTLQNIQGVRETTTFNLFVPQSARLGKATLMVGDGFSLVGADPDERAIEMNSLTDLLRLLNNSMKNNHVYGLLVQSVPGLGLRGSRIEGVPPSISSLLGSDGDSNSNTLQRQIISRGVLPLEREVRGLVGLELEIE